MPLKKSIKNCQYGLECRRSDCWNKHPAGWAPAAKKCKFGDECCWTPQSCPGGGHVPCDNGTDCPLKGNGCSKDHRDPETLHVYQRVLKINKSSDIWTHFLDKGLTLTCDEWLDTSKMSSPDRNMLERSLKKAGDDGLLIYYLDSQTKWTDEYDPQPIEDEETTFIQVWFKEEWGKESWWQTEDEWVTTKNGL